MTRDSVGEGSNHSKFKSICHSRGTAQLPTEHCLLTKSLRVELLFSVTCLGHENRIVFVLDSSTALLLSQVILFGQLWHTKLQALRHSAPCPCRWSCV